MKFKVGDKVKHRSYKGIHIVKEVSICELARGLPIQDRECIVLQKSKHWKQTGQFFSWAFDHATSEEAKLYENELEMEK